MSMTQPAFAMCGDRPYAPKLPIERIFWGLSAFWEVVNGGLWGGWNQELSDILAFPNIFLQIRGLAIDDLSCDEYL